MSINNVNRYIPSQTVSPMDQLKKAAQGMEANFLKQLVRNMRKTVDESPEAKANRGLQLFRGMLDDKYAEQASARGGIGLADVIVKQLLEKMNPQPLPRQSLYTVNKNTQVDANKNTQVDLNKNTQEGVNKSSK